MCEAISQGGHRCTNSIRISYENISAHIANLETRLESESFPQSKHRKFLESLERLKNREAKFMKAYFATPEGIQELRNKLRDTSLSFKSRNKVEVELAAAEATLAARLKANEIKRLKNNNIKTIMKRDGFSNDVIAEINSLLDLNPAMRSYKHYQERVQKDKQLYDAALSRVQLVQAQYKANPTNQILAERLKRADRNFREKQIAFRDSRAIADASSEGLELLKEEIESTNDLKRKRQLITRYSSAKQWYKHKLDGRYRRDTRLKLIKNAYESVGKNPDVALRAAKEARFSDSLNATLENEYGLKAKIATLTSKEKDQVKSEYKQYVSDTGEKITFKDYALMHIMSEPKIDRNQLTQDPLSFAQSKLVAVSPHRQKTVTEELRNAEFRLRLNSEDIARLETLSRKYGMTVSSFIRLQLLKKPVNHVDNDRSIKANMNKQESIQRNT